uniref:Uncharacterized protein n=1 Tax=Oryza punctata TaxID=4537 RepID=A0A0E0L233_ORYPU
MPSLLDSPPQMTPVAAAAGDWSSLYAAQTEPVKGPRHHVVSPAAAVKKTAYGGGGRRIKNLEMCTEALGCETGGVDGAAAVVFVAAPAAEDAMAVVETDGAERKRRAREEAESMKEKQLIKQEAEDAAIVAKEHQDADDEATPEEEYGGVAKYVRGGRCVEAEVAAAAAARRGKNWEPEQAAPFWVATS